MRNQAYELIASATGLTLENVKVRSYAGIRDIGVCRIGVAGKWHILYVFVHVCQYVRNMK